MTVHHYAALETGGVSLARQHPLHFELLNPIMRKSRAYDYTRVGQRMKLPEKTALQGHALESAWHSEQCV